MAKKHFHDSSLIFHLLHSWLWKSKRTEIVTSGNILVSSLVGPMHKSQCNSSSNLVHTVRRILLYKASLPARPKNLHVIMFNSLLEILFPQITFFLLPSPHTHTLTMSCTSPVTVREKLISLEPLPGVWHLNNVCRNAECAGTPNSCYIFYI